MKCVILTLGYLATGATANACGNEGFSPHCILELPPPLTEGRFDGAPNRNTTYCEHLCETVANGQDLYWETNMTGINRYERRTLIDDGRCRVSISAEESRHPQPDHNLVIVKQNLLWMLAEAVNVSIMYPDGSVGAFGTMTCDGKRFTYWVE
ncbi:hypothetical protein PFICI_13535 [Pestalotiopsis fici W106-1]|uniref:Ecp2 effector protein-like domain-containing protein n=1 Tax=Pestalotiopsis fici (strain W106-1 / CGMCC3.15140) TaxID=1229662 RepID=W3WQE4_PESFW|nr:uncharacterized protein PFICI_13535 [Pestalotiopsis fici W106-1]ETS75051.1 hypothetical protein PFICI_13535 [Pestalotiopsis fici W106-1]